MNAGGPAFLVQPFLFHTSPGSSSEIVKRERWIRTSLFSLLYSLFPDCRTDCPYDPCRTRVANSLRFGEAENHLTSQEPRSATQRRRVAFASRLV